MHPKDGDQCYMYVNHRVAMPHWVGPRVFQKIKQYFCTEAKHYGKVLLLRTTQELWKDFLSPTAENESYGQD